MYADLNVIWPEGPRAEIEASRILAFHELLGYDVVAFNVVSPTVKAAKQVFSTSLSAATLARLQEKFPKIRLLRRATLILDDSSVHPNVAQLVSEPDPCDIVAVLPRTEKQLQSCAISLDIDMICIETSARLPFRLKHSLVGSAIKRGVLFEICYDFDKGNKLRHVVTNAAMTLRAARSRGLVVSSGASQEMSLRAPKDIENLLQLWGFPRGAAHSSVSTNPMQVATQGVLRIRSLKQAIISPPTKKQKTS